MRKILILFLLFFYTASNANSFKENILIAERGFQEDADLVRLQDLAYWTGLIEKYQSETGFFPFQNELQENEVVAVKIATKFQQQFDKNKRSDFKEKSMKDFVSLLSSQFGKHIDERYDIQKVPTNSPVGYHYFVTKDGYLLWVTCITCGVTPISTLLLDGITPTVNITSDGMVDKVTKAMTRKAMLSHPIYKGWVSRKFHKKAYIESLVEKNINDSKKQ